MTGPSLRAFVRTLLIGVVGAAPVLAQEAAPPQSGWEGASDDEDDLEVPAGSSETTEDATGSPGSAPGTSAGDGAPQGGTQGSAADSSSASSAPAPSAAPAEEPQQEAQAADAQQGSAQASASLSGGAGAFQATAPVGEGEKAPRTLVAEGSNYWRPLRRGLTWWGFVQAQYRQNQLSEDQLAQGGTPLNQNQFELRRARLRIDHGWEYAAATLELDASTMNGLEVGVRRAEASLLYRGEDDSLPPLFVLTAGVTDLPFGAEIGESQRDRVFMERSIGSLALFPSEADIGVRAWGAYRFVNYAVAVVNGQPLAQQKFARDPNAAKDIVGHFGARGNLSDDLQIEGGLSFYKGTGFSPGRDATKDQIVWIDDNNNGIAEPYEFFGVTGSAAQPSRNFDRWALGLDLGASLTTPLGLTRLQSEVAVASNLDRGLLVSDPVLAGRDARQLVLTVSLVQQLTDYGLVGLRAAFYDPDSDLVEQRTGVFHTKNQTFWVLSPAVGLTLPSGRLVAQYDFVKDYLGRDSRGVPSNAKNDQFTVRLQVDL